MNKENRLDGVAGLSVGQQAALRREAGKCLREADARALQAFFTALPKDVPSWQQERYYAVMCMMCLWKQEDRVNPKPFAECLRLIRKSDSADGRFRTLLDTPWQDDEGFLIGKLSRFAKQIRSAPLTLYPDLEQLLNDLMYWNVPQRTVQRRWMEQYLNADVPIDDADKTQEKSEEEKDHAV